MPLLKLISLQEFNCVNDKIYFLNFDILKKQSHNISKKKMIIIYLIALIWQKNKTHIKQKQEIVENNKNKNVKT